MLLIEKPKIKIMISPQNHFMGFFCLKRKENGTWKFGINKFGQRPQNHLSFIYSVIVEYIKLWLQSLVLLPSLPEDFLGELRESANPLSSPRESLSDFLPHHGNLRISHPSNGGVTAFPPLNRGPGDFPAFCWAHSDGWQSVTGDYEHAPPAVAFYLVFV